MGVHGWKPPNAALARVDRRRLLIGAGVLAGAAMAGPAIILGGSASAVAGDEFDGLRARWAALITGAPVDPADPAYASALARLNATAQQLRGGLNTDAARTALWTDMPIGPTYPSANVTTCFDRLRTLAMCWATTGGVYHADDGTATIVVGALDFLNATAYHAGQVEYGNWWDWEIGSAQALQDSCVLLYARITGGQLAKHLAAVDHFVPSPYTMMSQTLVSTGANRADLARVVALRGVLGKLGAKLAAARDSLSDSMRYVLVGDGLYQDGSYVLHTNVAVTGSYGVGQLNGTAALTQLLQGSSWPVTDANLANLRAAVAKSFAPFVYRGLMTDTVRSRSISRSYVPDAADGLSAALAVLRLALTAPAAQAAEFRSLAKGWLLANTVRPVGSYADVAGLALAKPVLDDGSISAATELAEHHLLADMDRAVHRRPGWAFSLALSSARIARLEAINGENLHGWHTGDGMGLLHLDSDPIQYNDGYWPTVDPYRLPGTTVDTGTLADGAGNKTLPAAVWVGGTVLDGQYASIGMDLRGFKATLSAKKSWFCLDDCVVALGAAITSTDGRRVETVLENRKLHTGAGPLTVDGVAAPEALGSTLDLSTARWAHLAGTGGYLFHDAGTRRALRQDRTGSWHDINTGGSSTPITRRYLTMWLDHGVNPAGASYAYTLLPGFTVPAAAARAASGTVQILANTASVQAVTHTGLGLTAANFFTSGSVGGITVDAPCSVMLRATAGQLTVAVADPTRAAATATVQIARAGYVAAAPGPGMNVISAGTAGITLLVEVGGGHGGTRQATFSTTGAPVASGAAKLLPPLADGYVRDGSSSGTNFASEATLLVKRSAANDGYNRVVYLRFDLSGITRPVTRAVLWVYGKTADANGIQTTLRAWPVANDNWTESGLTWTNRPPLGSTALGTDVALATAADWVGLDVTAHVRASARPTGGDGLASLAVWQSTAPGLLVMLNSRQSPTNQPRLQVTTR